MTCSRFCRAYMERYWKILRHPNQCSIDELVQFLKASVLVYFTLMVISFWDSVVNTSLGRRRHNSKLYVYAAFAYCLAFLIGLTISGLVFISMRGRKPESLIVDAVRAALALVCCFASFIAIYASLFRRSPWAVLQCCFLAFHLTIHYVLYNLKKKVVDESRDSAALMHGAVGVWSLHDTTNYKL
jgi:hypothetical protein